MELYYALASALVASFPLICISDTNALFTGRFQSRPCLRGKWTHFAGTHLHRVSYQWKACTIVQLTHGTDTRGYSWRHAGASTPTGASGDLLQVKRAAAGLEHRLVAGHLALAPAHQLRHRRRGVRAHRGAVVEGRRRRQAEVGEGGHVDRRDGRKHVLPERQAGGVLRGGDARSAKRLQPTQGALSCSDGRIVGAAGTTNAATEWMRATRPSPTKISF